MGTILSAILALSMVGGVQDDKDDVASAAKKSFGSNYSFKGQSLFDMPSFGGGGDREPTPSKFKGKHDGDVGTHILTETQEIVKVGDKTATRPRATWTVREENPEGGRRRGGRRGRRGGMFGGRGVNAPHVELNGLGDKLSSAEKTDDTETVGETDCTIYTGKFSEEAAKGFFGGGRMFSRLEEAEFSAKGKFWLDDEGNLVKYEVKATLVAVIRDNEIEISVTRTVTIYDVGTTKVKIPAGALKAIKGDGEDY